jgi:hypothetical protein
LRVPHTPVIPAQAGTHASLRECNVSASRSVVATRIEGGDPPHEKRMLQLAWISLYSGMTGVLAAIACVFTNVIPAQAGTQSCLCVRDVHLFEQLRLGSRGIRGTAPPSLAVGPCDLGSRRPCEAWLRHDAGMTCVGTRARAFRCHPRAWPEDPQGNGLCRQSKGAAHIILCLREPRAGSSEQVRG